MEKVQHGPHTLEITADVNDLTIDRFNLFNLYMLQDAGIGSTIEDINARFQGLDVYLAHNKISEARTERRNLQGLFFGILNQINYSQRAFACLIHSIDGVKYQEVTESAITQVVEKLKDIHITQNHIRELILQKKSTYKPSWSRTFLIGLKARISRIGLRTSKSSSQKAAG